MSRTMVILCLAAALPALLPGAARGAEQKIGFRQLSIITPGAVQQGTTSEVKVHSNFTLDGTHTVLFNRPGLSMKLLETKPIEAPRQGRGRVGTPFRFEVIAPAEQPRGVYEVRMATKTAVSSVTHLLVTDAPVVEEQSGENGTPETAQQVSVPVCLAGRTERSEDVDYVRFAGVTGQELTCEIFAQRLTEAIHSMQSGNKVYLMDPLLTLMTADGRIIAQNDNKIGADSLITCTLPEDGDYLLEIRDTRYAGNVKYSWCVEITDQPRVASVFPFAVQAGTQTTVAVNGQALGGTETAVITAADDATTGLTEFPIETARGLAGPASVLVSEHPQVLSTGENLSPEAAMPVELPAGINGRFAESQQAHYFSIACEKGRTYRFEVVASRLNLPLDGLLEVYDAEGKLLTEMDDGLQTRDPRLYFKAPADGTYLLALRDLHDRGGEGFQYHLQAEPSGPDFEVHGEYYYAQLAPGTRMMWFARIVRLNGYTGPVTISVENLPEGVSCQPVTIPPGLTHCSLVLEAAAGAPIGASLARTVGTATIEDPAGETRTIKREGRVTCELQTQGGGQVRWPISTQIVGVTEPLDLLEVTAEPAAITLKPGEKQTLKVRIRRNKGFTEPVLLDMTFTYFSAKLGEQLPPGVTVAKESKLRLAGKVLEGTIVLEADAKKATPVENWPVAALVRVPITFSITTNYASNPISLTVLKAE
ncbi:MAG: hypothetical protein KDA79_07195 [Planctomycetaceae bacterium]|nr:hypothetical protein [Planctomycetaceae bacterium]